ncbi:YCF48-related protein [Kangiella marina]|uniref:YCF48-related protein n=2 Tax=Kangiella marina TaxID=1079178 RepID=A0ABP8IEZ8_9GAMM
MILQAGPAVIAPKAKSSLLLDIVKVSDERFVTVGQRGHILITDDSGQTWRQVPVPVDVNLTAVDFLDDKRGVAVGFDQTVLLTTDAGETWVLSHQEVSNLQPALFNVLYTSEDNITAIGSYGLYLESTDGGETWENREIASLSDVYDGFSHFYDLEQLSGDTWYMAGEKYIAEADEMGEEFSKGMIAVTKDAGETWQKLDSPYEGSFFGISVNGSDIYVYGLRGNLFHSNDDGVTWTSIRLQNEAGLHDMLITPQGELVLVGTGGVLVTKKGNDVSIRKRTDLKGRAALVGLGDNRFIIVGEGGVETFDAVSSKKSVKEGQKDGK